MNILDENVPERTNDSGNTIPLYGLGADYASVHQEMRPEIERSERIAALERAVVDAAVKVRNILRDRDNGTWGSADEFAHLHVDEFSGYGDANADLLIAVDRLLEEREK